MSVHVRRPLARRLLVAVALVAIAGVVPLPASASATGTEHINLVLPTGIDIDGIVLDPLGNPIEGADAGICPDEFDCFAASGVTDASGRYVGNRAVAGSYLVKATARGYVDVWLGAGGSSVTDVSQAITVDISGDTTLPTLQLAAGFSMAGTLSDPEGHGIAGVEVTANGESSGGGIGTTDANGQFVITGLRAGFYSVEVAPPVGSPFTGGNIAGGTIVHPDFFPNVEVSGDTTGVDATLVVGRTISGTVTGLTRPADVDVSGTVHGRSLEIAPDGTFSATGLWPDELQSLWVVSRSTGGFDEQFPYGVYDGTSNLNPDQSTAVDIDVSGGDVTGLTLAVPTLPSVTGTILDENGTAVAGFTTFCSDDLGCAASTIASDGSFEFLNLPNSTFHMYLVGFNRKSGYVTAAGGVSGDFADAADIVVAGVDQVVDVVVPVGLTISGTITGPDGEPVVGANPVAFLPDGPVAAGTYTDENGNYVLEGLDPGDYYVHVSGPEPGPYLSGYWSQSGYTTEIETADLVHVPSDGVAVVSTNPTDGATGVARTVQPSVTFSGSVDVSAAVVSLKGGRVPVAMRGTIAYDDATHTLTFKPRGRLIAKTTYVFEVSGLTASGVPIDPVTVTFTTQR